MRSSPPGLVLTISALLALSCAWAQTVIGLPQRSASPQPPAVSPTATSPPVPTDALPQGPGLPAGLLPRMAVGEMVRIRQVHMRSETQGWAIGGSEAREDRILVTADGGRNWREVTPPQPLLEGADYPGQATAFFLDVDHAWVSYYPVSGMVPEPAVVWRTQDGGETWEAGKPPCDEMVCGGHGPLALRFADARNGWLMRMLDAGMGHAYVALYATGDGGRTWAALVDPTSAGSGNLHTCCQTAMAFADPLRGLVTFARGPNERVLIDWTLDGGLTWNSQSLPPPAPGSDELEFNGLNCGTFWPQFLPNGMTILALECFLESRSPLGGGTYFYSSLDFGQTWRANEYPGGQLIFLDPDTGWAFGREHHRTEDGGRSWSGLGSVEWEGQFSILSSELLWAAAKGASMSGLVRSVDGGLSWEAIETRIGP